MNKVLIKYKEVAFLIDESARDNSMQELIATLPQIYELYKLSHSIYPKGLISAEEEQLLKDERAKLADFKTKYNVIGYPFDAKDARMFALTKKINFVELELK